jgi:putative transposase
MKQNRMEITPVMPHCDRNGYKVADLPLSVPQWTCPGCSVSHDRNLNAAKNLAAYAVSSTVSSCGEEGAGSGHKTGVESASVKQEVSFVSV